MYVVAVFSSPLFSLPPVHFSPPAAITNHPPPWPCPLRRRKTSAGEQIKEVRRTVLIHPAIIPLETIRLLPASTASPAHRTATASVISAFLLLTGPGATVPPWTVRAVLIATVPMMRTPASKIPRGVISAFASAIPTLPPVVATDISVSLSARVDKAGAHPTRVAPMDRVALLPISKAHFPSLSNAQTPSAITSTSVSISPPALLPTWSFP